MKNDVVVSVRNTQHLFQQNWKKKIENRAEATFESKITADFPELVEDSGNPTNPKQGNKREIQHKDLS